MSKDNIRADRGEAEKTHSISEEEMEFLLFIHENLPSMSSDLRQGWMNNPNAFRKILAKLSPDKTIPSVVGVYNNTSHHRFLISLILAPTSGLATIAQAKDVFTDYVDQDFINWKTDFPGEDTPESEVAVHNITNRNGTPRQIFRSFGVSLDSLCLSQGQIIEFARTQCSTLYPDDCVTLFLFEMPGIAEPFVAQVLAKDEKLGVNALLLDFDDLWDSDSHYRLVVKQHRA